MPDSIKEAAAKVAKEFGRIDILVNNAGITKDGLGAAHEEGRLGHRALDQSHRRVSHVQQVLQGMMRERWGRIINISSVVGEMGNPGQANYVASKAGLSA